VTRYPRAARLSRLKCISCNAPVVETIDDEYVCVECGTVPIEDREMGETAERRSVSRPEDGGETRSEVG
jgi:hypothetical protein